MCHGAWGWTGEKGKWLLLPMAELSWAPSQGDGYFSGGVGPTGISTTISLPGVVSGAAGNKLGNEGWEAVKAPARLRGSAALPPRRRRGANALQTRFYRGDEMQI